MLNTYGVSMKLFALILIVLAKVFSFTYVYWQPFLVTDLGRKKGNMNGKKKHFSSFACS